MGDKYHPSGLPDPEDTGDELFPDRRKHGYKELEDKLDQHAEEIKQRLAMFIRRGLIAFAIIGIFTAMALLGFGFLLREQHQTTDLIQQQRRDSVRVACEDQNTRHDKTIAVLDKVFKQVLKDNNTSDAEKKQVAASRQYNVLLINALAPHQDCAKLVNFAVPENGP